MFSQADSTALPEGPAFPFDGPCELGQFPDVKTGYRPICWKRGIQLNGHGSDRVFVQSIHE